MLEIEIETPLDQFYVGKRFVISGDTSRVFINYDFPDPECPLDIVPNDARQAKVDVAFNNAFAFGGLNSVLAIRRVP